MDFFSQPRPSECLPPRLFATVEESRVPILAMHIFWYGYESLPTNEKPVKVLILVEAGKVDWHDGTRLAQSCHSVLLRFGLDDVH